MKTKKQKYIYTYGIINNCDVKFAMKGLRNEPIKKIDFNEISVVTSIYPTLYPTLKEDEAMQHSDILKKIIKKTTVIPTAFGTVFKNQKIIEAVLSKSYYIIKETLDLINGKFELGVKVVKKSPDETHDGIAQEILNSLDKLSVKSVKGDKFSERLLLNHSFLVEKNKFSKFSDKIAKLEKKYKNLKFLYTGPWPPYSFVNINIRGGG